MNSLLENPEYAYLKRNVARMVGIPELLSSGETSKVSAAHAILENIIKPMLTYNLESSIKASLNGYKDRVTEYLLLLDQCKITEAKTYASRWLNEFQS